MRNRLQRAIRYARCNNRRRLSWLLRRHPELRSQWDGDSSLLWDAYWFRPELLPWLLEQGLDPDLSWPDDGNTLLMSAASDGAREVVGVLIRHGADVRRTNKSGETALSYCCSYADLDIARLLVEAGADLNSVDEGGGTPLDCAVCGGSEELRSWLIEQGAQRRLEFEPWPVEPGRRS